MFRGFSMVPTNGMFTAYIVGIAMPTNRAKIPAIKPSKNNWGGYT